MNHHWSRALWRPVRAVMDDLLLGSPLWRRNHVQLPHASLLDVPFRAPRCGCVRSTRGQYLRSGRPRLLLEVLEDRSTPAVLTVNTAADNTTDTSALTLRDAITLVNNGGNPTSLGQTSMPAGWRGSRSTPRTRSAPTTPSTSISPPRACRRSPSPRNCPPSTPPSSSMELPKPVGRRTPRRHNTTQT